MKQMIFSAMLLLMVGSITAQTESTNRKKFFYGFDLGMNHTHIQISKDNSITSVQNDFGFRLGLIAGSSLTDRVRLTINPALSFHNNILFYKPESSMVHTAFGTSFDFSILGTYGLNSHQNLSPYLTLGPTIQISLIDPEFSNQFKDRPNIGIEFGLGCAIKLKAYTLVPELRYAYGLTNINSNPTIPPSQVINFHSLKLVIGFTSLHR
ncbi:MAG: outer membrane beta-barrel protein [Putridiphycobacter sp.]|nr:outer membrane beta-barrel protein [Putridiphycobacter sp.]